MNTTYQNNRDAKDQMIYQSLNNLTNIGVTPIAKFLTNPATVTSKQNIENSQFIYNYKQEAQSLD
jgi:hypothetical protein